MYGFLLSHNLSTIIITFQVLYLRHASDLLLGHLRKLYICRTLLMYLMFTPADSFSMRIVLLIFLFLTVVGILIATAMLIYECCHNTEKCNKKKGLTYV